LFSNLTFNPTLHLWSTRLSTSRYGQSTFNITTTGSPRIQGEKIATIRGILNVHWIFSPSLSAISQFQTTASPTALEMKSHSPWLATTTIGNEVITIFSTDQFKTLERVDLISRNELVRDRIDTCTGVTTSQLVIKDIAIHDQTVYLSTNTGVFYGSETTPSVGWVYISNHCVGHLKIHNQQSYDKHWKPLILIGSGTSTGLIWMFNNGILVPTLVY
jgi:hypothetical protein